MVGEPATEAKMDELWESVQAVDSNVQRSDTQAKQLKSRTKLNDFMEHCTLSRKYFFMVKKCGASECQICKPPRLDKTVFDTLKNFPDPEPRADDPARYMEFEDIYGQQTSERFCPSATQILAPTGDGCSVKMSAETTRDYVVCVDCGKPRCIYSLRKLQKKEKADLAVLKEEVIYTCGGVLVPSDHELEGTVGVQPNTTCLTPVVAHYYSPRLAFPLVCFNCGSSDIADIPVELKAQFQTVHPVCHECHENSVKERTRGAKKMRKS